MPPSVDAKVPADVVHEEATDSSTGRAVAVGRVLLWSAFALGMVALQGSLLFGFISADAISGGTDPVIGTSTWFGALLVLPVLILFAAGVLLDRGSSAAALVGGFVGLLAAVASTPAAIAIILLTA